MHVTALSGNLVSSWMENLVDWCADTFAETFDMGANNMLQVLGCRLDTFKTYFAIVDVLSDVFYAIGWGMIVVIFLYSLFRSMVLPARESEHPLRLLARYGIAMFCTAFALMICQLCLDIAQVPYEYLVQNYFTVGSGHVSGNTYVSWAGLFSTMLVNADGIPAKIFALILFVMIAWNYFQLLLELVEHYVVMGFLSYASPIAFACYTSQTTENVTKSFLKMYLSQLLMMILTAWFIIGATFAINDYIGAINLQAVTDISLTQQISDLIVSGIENAAGINEIGTTAGNGTLIWSFCMLAFLKTGQRVDNYLKSLGLNVATTGANLGSEMLSTVAQMRVVGAGAAKTAGAVFGSGTVHSAMAGNFAAAEKNVSSETIGVTANSKDAEGVPLGTDSKEAGFFQNAAAAYENEAVKNGDSNISAETYSAVANDPNSKRKIDDEVTAASRDFGNYMPALQGKNLSGTSITSGRFKTTMTGSDGKKTNLEGFNTSMYDVPVGAGYRMMKAADGSTWAVKADGSGSNSFYRTPFVGSGRANAARFSSEAAEKGVAGISNVIGADGQPETGVLHAEMADGSQAMLYNTGLFDIGNSDDIETIRDNEGNEWGIVPDRGVTPDFAAETPDFVDDDDYKGFFTDPYAGDYFDENSGVKTVDDGIIASMGGEKEGLWLRQGEEGGVSGFDISDASGTLQDVNGDTWGFFPNARTDRMPANRVGSSSVNGSATPQFSGIESAAAIQKQFPGLDAVSAKTVDNGMIGVTNADGSQSTLLNEGIYNTPAGNYSKTFGIDPVTGQQNVWYKIDGAPGTHNPGAVNQRVSAKAESTPKFSGVPDGTKIHTIGNDAAIATDKFGNTTRLTRNGGIYNGMRTEQYKAEDGTEWSGSYGRYNAPAALNQTSDAPRYTGHESTAQIQKDFPEMKNAVTANTVADGVIQMRDNKGGISTLYRDGSDGKGGYAAPSGSSSHVTSASGTGYWKVNDGSVPRAYNGGSQFSDTTSQDEFRESFPTMPEGTVYHAVGTGAVRATYANGSSDMLYSSANYSHPRGCETVSDTSGNSWMRVGAQYDTPVTNSTPSGAINSRTFASYMPSYSDTFGKEASSFRTDKFDRFGRFEVLNSDGTGTKFYDTAMYKQPKGDYKVIKNFDGHSYYGVSGKPKMYTEPVMRNGTPVMKDGKTVMSRRYTMDYGQSPEKLSAKDPVRRSKANTSENKYKTPRRQNRSGK